jgi:hypothetical protein
MILRPTPMKLSCTLYTLPPIRLGYVSMWKIMVMARRALASWEPPVRVVVDVTILLAPLCYLTS